MARMRVGGREVIFTNGAVAFLLGFVVWLLVMPFRGVLYGNGHPECFSIVGYGVPCDGPLALLAGLAAGFLFLLVLRLIERSRATRGDEADQ
jgi:hypothetical protein